MLTWIYLAITSLAVAEGPLPHWAQSYVELATDIEQAAQDHPLAGPDGEKRMAAVLVALAYHESRFNPDAVGDGGHSLGAFQISSHWAGQDADTAARLVQESFRVCKDKPIAERLGWYASGGASCDGLKASRIRMSLARRLVR